MIDLCYHTFVVLVFYFPYMLFTILLPPFSRLCDKACVSQTLVESSISCRTNSVRLRSCRFTPSRNGVSNCLTDADGLSPCSSPLLYPDSPSSTSSSTEEQVAIRTSPRFLATRSSNHKNSGSRRLESLCTRVGRHRTTVKETCHTQSVNVFDDHSPPTLHVRMTSAQCNGFHLPSTSPLYSKGSYVSKCALSSSPLYLQPSISVTPLRRSLVSPFKINSQGIQSRNLVFSLTNGSIVVDGSCFQSKTTDNVNEKTAIVNSDGDRVCNNSNNNTNVVSSPVVALTESVASSCSNTVLSCRSHSVRSCVGRNSFQDRESDVLCLWQGCGVRMKPADLLEHLVSVHVERQKDKERFVCEWQRCKMSGRTSCSISWLMQHVATHGGDKPFKCIIDGCVLRFATKVALERHVNTHFANSPSKIISTRNGANVYQSIRTRKKRLKRRRPHSREYCLVVSDR